jgi:amino acid transporter
MFDARDSKRGGARSFVDGDAASRGEATAAPGARLQREFSLRTAFSLAFAFISPIVALYTIFALGVGTAGPGFWLGFPVAMAGQLLVALVFSMLASRYPLEGSVYQWSRMLAGKRYGWFAGWTYIWTLLITMAAVSLGGAGFLAQLLGLDPGNGAVSTFLALCLLAFATWGNTRGRRVLAAMVWLCVMAELVGSVGVGSFLLLTGRMHSPAVIFADADFLAPGPGWLGFLDTKAAAAVAICGWAFVGFESAGAIAEEVKDPSRNVPRAMIGALLFVAVVVSFSGLALLLSLPNLADVAAGKGGDPVVGTLIYHFGPVAYRFLLVLFVIGFLACLLGVQTSVSRVLWAFARDGELPAAGLLSRLSGNDQLPAHAVAASGGLAATIFALSFTNLYAVLVDFTTAGFYIAFGFPVLAAAWRILRGRWEPTPFHLGPLGTPVVFCASAWTVFEAVNIAWPRIGGAPWYETWSVVLMVALLGALGVAVRGSLDHGSRAERR